MAAAFSSIRASGTDAAEQFPKDRTQPWDCIGSNRRMNMSDIRQRLRATPYIPALALAFGALLAGCQSPTVNEVHRIALDSMPPPHAAADEHRIDAWRLADAAQRVQQRARARSAQPGHAHAGDRELHVIGIAARAVHPIAGPGAPTPVRTAPTDGERSLVAAR
jgi:hypothetical protein